MFELVIDNAKLQVHCHEDAPPTPIVIDLPAWKVGDFESDNLTTTDTSTELVLPDAFGQMNFGAGYFSETEQVGGGYPNLVYMPVTPDGYELSHATYVVIAYRSWTDGTPDPSHSDYSGYVPDPADLWADTSWPFISLDSSGTGGWYAMFGANLPGGAYGPELVWPGSEILSRLTAASGSQLPANRLWVEETTPGSVGAGNTDFPTKIHVAYWAIRLTYTAI